MCWACPAVGIEVGKAVGELVVEASVASGEGYDLHSLHCSCKVVRIFSGNVTVSLWRNRTMPGPKGDVVPYEWEALWTIGYSDGVTETSSGIYGDIDTEVMIENYEVVRVRDALDVDESKPSNMCGPSKTKPKPSPDAIMSLAPMIIAR